MAHVDQRVMNGRVGDELKLLKDLILIMGINPCTSPDSSLTLSPCPHTVVLQLGVVVVQW